MTTAALLNCVEAARVLNKSKRTVQRMAQRGELPLAKKLDGSRGAYLFPEDGIVAMTTSLTGPDGAQGDPATAALEPMKQTAGETAAGERSAPPFADPPAAPS